MTTFRLPHIQSQTPYPAVQDAAKSIEIELIEIAPVGAYLRFLLGCKTTVKRL
jgi:hypothetical protein